MEIEKQTRTLEQSWGRVSDFTQALRVGDTITLAGRATHLDAEDNFGRFGEMEVQMRRMYSNVARLLEEYDAGMANIVDEVVYVKDLEAAREAHARCREDYFGTSPILASTIVQIERLPLPESLIEIKCTAKVEDMSER